MLTSAQQNELGFLVFFLFFGFWFLVFVSQMVDSAGCLGSPYATVVPWASSCRPRLVCRCLGVLLCRPGTDVTGEPPDAIRKPVHRRRTGRTHVGTETRREAELHRSFLAISWCVYQASDTSYDRAWLILYDSGPACKGRLDSNIGTKRSLFLRPE